MPSPPFRPLQSDPDELNALRRMVAHAKTGAPLTIEEIQAWHREATRHQEDRLVEVESDEGTLTRLRVPMVPRQFKEHENLIVSGHTEYEFCPPERARTELEKIVGLDETHRAGPSSTAMCAVWMHAAFNSVHPFPDSNGRTGRLLMAMGLPAPKRAPSVDRDRRPGRVFSGDAQGTPGRP